ncbi:MULTISPECIES: Rv3654c family TadE-like protein [unclassified Pseudactinotalea]|uniref:Rv3654c family TadE-like protein n=1 Tax=unclassified Pseudactinotalea TaxID=2649176 RepID=UPI00128C33F7|nr:MULTISPECIES: Rv3654c family TadE-like protein [unclassified Pseudactinotalea]MPV48948.1 hypothetical protein [Pseudactinotalea sp. HY160]QGH68371.1 hypothetical protein GCE65_01730 [Pseudactinotalea sp. HY158]
MNDTPAGGAGRDRGSATVLTLAVACAALLAAIVLAGLVQAYSARARAQGAADLAALAGAAQAVRAGDGCGAAGQVARRNDARIASCVQDPGGVVLVRVRVPSNLPLLGSGNAWAAARAGPVR